MDRSQNGRKPFRFLWNQSRATAHNIYLLLYPRGALQAALNENPALYGLVFQALQRLDTNGFMGQGRVYGGGLLQDGAEGTGPRERRCGFSGDLTGAGVQQALAFLAEGQARVPGRGSR
jgi:hypothetical protein